VQHNRDAKIFVLHLYFDADLSMFGKFSRIRTPQKGPHRTENTGKQHDLFWPAVVRIQKALYLSKVRQ